MLRDGSGAVVDRLSGIIGVEHDFRALAYRRVGVWRPPAACVQVIVVDPELDRDGVLLTAEDLRHEITKGPANILPSTAAIGARLLDGSWGPIIPASRMGRGSAGTSGPGF